MSIKYLKCQMCKKQFPENELLMQESSKLLFCKKDFSEATIIIGLMDWSKSHPEYEHPLLPKIPKEATFDDVLDMYRFYTEKANQNSIKAI